MVHWDGKASACIGMPLLIVYLIGTLSLVFSEDCQSGASTDQQLANSTSVRAITKLQPLVATTQVQNHIRCFQQSHLHPQLTWKWKTSCW